MKVLLATDVIGPGGGPAGYTFNLLEGFAARGTAEDGFSVEGEVALENARYRGTGEKKAEGGLLAGVRWLLARLPHVSLHRLLSTARWLTSDRDRKHRVKYADADVIVFQGYQPSIRGRWAKRHGKTVIYMPHSPNPVADEMRILELARDGFSPQPRFDFLRWDENRFLEIADVVAMASPGATDQYRETFPETVEAANVRYVWSGVAVPRPRTAPAAASEAAPIVLYAGRYVSHKGYDLFLEAARIAADLAIEGRFCTLGTGPDARPSPFVEDLGWSEDPASYLRDAAVVVVPNRIAYFDLLPLEAAALGKPLVLTRVGGSVDQLRMLPDSIGTEPEAGNIARAVGKALDEVRRSSHYGTRNAQAYRELFTPEQLAQHWAAMLRDVIDAGQRPSEVGDRPGTRSTGSPR